MNSTVMMVATRKNAVSGSYCSPSQIDTPTPTTSCAHTATRGDFHCGCRSVKLLGSNRTRPMANQVRVAAFDPAFALAIVELTMARNTNTHAPPHIARPRPSQPTPGWKLIIFVGPVNTVAAYVVST